MFEWLKSRLFTASTACCGLHPWLSGLFVGGVTLTKNLKLPRGSSVCTTLNFLTLTFLSPWQRLSKIYWDGPVIDFKLYLEISFMSYANDEKWDLKRPIWPWSWTRMTGCRRTHRCLALQLWLVLDCSVQQSMKGTPPLLLLIDVALKVWNRSWQWQRESQDQQ